MPDLDIGKLLADIEGTGLPPFQTPGTPAAESRPGPVPTGVDSPVDVRRLLQTLTPSLAPQPAPAGGGGTPGPRFGGGGAFAPPGLPALPPRRQLPTPPKAQYTDPLLALTQPITAMALIGSLFTRRSATTALNAAGNAMMALKQNDQLTYENHFKEYQQELAKVRAEMEQDYYDYQRDFENRKLSMTERLAGMRGTAARRRDSAMTTYLDAGGNPGELLGARQQAFLKLKAGERKAIALQGIKDEHPDWSLAQVEGDYQRQVAEAKSGGARAKTMTQQEAMAVDELVAQGTPREEAIVQVKTGAPKEMVRVKHDVTMEELEKKHELRMDEEAQREIARIERAKALGESKERIVQMQNESRERLKERDIEGKKEIAQQRAQQQRSISPNKAADIEQRDTLVQEGLDTLDESLNILQKYRMAAGLAGKAFRGIEVIGNISGADVQSDRVQLRRNLEQLMSLYGRVLGQGRPLALDARHLEDVVGGLGYGDTTTNTIRALENVRNTFLRFHQTNKRILEGAGAQSPAGSPTPTPSGEPAQSAPAPTIDWSSMPQVQ